jgi:hypothetical protein
LSSIRRIPDRYDGSRLERIVFDGDWTGAYAEYLSVIRFRLFDIIFRDSIFSIWKEGVKENFCKRVHDSPALAGASFVGLRSFVCGGDEHVPGVSEQEYGKSGVTFYKTEQDRGVDKYRSACLDDHNVSDCTYTVNRLIYKETSQHKIDYTGIDYFRSRIAESMKGPICFERWYSSKRQRTKRRMQDF